MEKFLLRESDIIAVLKALNFKLSFEKVGYIANFRDYWRGLSAGWNQWSCEVGGVSVELDLYYGNVDDFLTELVDQKKGKRNCELSDVWFLDGFAPSKNQEMWSPNVFEKMGKVSKVGTSYSTFTVAGKVRRGLLEAGFSTDKILGYGKKREMLLGYFKNLIWT